MKMLYSYNKGCILDIIHVTKEQMCDFNILHRQALLWSQFFGYVLLLFHIKEGWLPSS